MELTFQLSNEKFEDTLAVCINGETKHLTSDNTTAVFSVEQTQELRVQISYLRDDMSRIKHPVARFFMWILVCLLSPLVFFCDNDMGIGIHKFFHDAKPFDITKTYHLRPVQEVITVQFLPARYHKVIKQFSAPNILIGAQETTQEQTDIRYAPRAMKCAFRAYHYPAYALLFALLLALMALMGVSLYNQFTPFDSAGVIALSLCLAVILALLIVFICLFAATHKLFRQVDRNLKNQT